MLTIRKSYTIHDICNACAIELDVLTMHNHSFILNKQVSYMLKIMFIVRQLIIKLTTYTLT